MNAGEGYALLDDAQADGAHSRLYSGLQKILSCHSAQEWPDFLHQTQAALQHGSYAVALLAYETGAQLQGIAAYPAAPPRSRMLLFRDCRRLDSRQVEQFLQTQGAAEGDEVAGVAALHANVDEGAFAAAIAGVRAYIAAGDTYQVNYTYRLHFDSYGTPPALYRRLRQRQPVPYGALICLPDGEAVLSLSPELFVRHQQGNLLARPMKGTAAASGDAGRDSVRAAELAADPKNRAENLMIVDLLRNDLGRIAQTGSVKVSKLFEVSRFSSVLQMTSTVEARLQPQLALPEILSALFPCGSITGAPKHRTMQIIRELESEPRGLYTGALGWFDPAPAATGDFCLAVPIRTLHLQPAAGGVRQGVLGVGAGIVYDSVAADEYAECRLKAKFLTGLPPQFDLLETMYASREQGCRHLTRHLARLRASAAYFGFACDEAAIVAALQAYCQALPPQTPQRLRLALQADGALRLSGGALPPLAAMPSVLLAAAATDSDHLFLRHKTTVRRQYDQAWQQAERQGAFDMLFFNQDGHLTEGGRSNVLLRKNGQWLTPPLSDGVLPGVMRAVLLDDPQWQLREQSLTLDDLRGAEQVMLCNALRGAFAVQVR
ncbi:MAG: aminodeoxychorismate synthase component I [Burkholderiales bacterium]|nr:aminodeoxychorismate synthase component I [Burkholderiales bacterium]